MMILDGHLDCAVVPAWTMSISLALMDLVVLTCTWALSVYLRLILGGVFTATDYFSMFPVVFIHLLLNAFLGSYNVLLSPPIELKRCTMGALLFVLIFTATTFWIRTQYSYSRGILLIGGLLMLVAIPAGRIAVRSWCGKCAWWGYRTVFYIYKDYDPNHLRRVLRNLSSCLRPSLLIFHDPKNAKGSKEHGVPTLSGPDWLDHAARRHPDSIFVFLAHAIPGAKTAEILGKAEHLFGRIIILHETLNMGNLWAKTVDIGTMLGLEAMQRLLDSKRMLLKTITDLFLSALLLLCLTPVFLFIALCIWLEDPGPLLYQHRRVGKNGKDFFALKFRTMYPNSEAILKATLDKDPLLRKLWEVHRKLPNDPRITNVGRILRHSSLDELPQLINVLRGEMSLIGPRPIMAVEIPFYNGRFQFVNQVRPGLTGLWQVSGRSRLTYAERVECDVYYIRNWSFWLDMHILLKTPAAVFDFSGTA